MTRSRAAYDRDAFSCCYRVTRLYRAVFLIVAACDEGGGHDRGSNWQGMIVGQTGGEGHDHEDLVAYTILFLRQEQSLRDHERGQPMAPPREHQAHLGHHECPWLNGR
jgi:hypothetical protein